VGYHRSNFEPAESQQPTAVVEVTAQGPWAKYFCSIGSVGALGTGADPAAQAGTVTTAIATPKLSRSSTARETARVVKVTPLADR
jgi:hypothetical protein